MGIYFANIIIVIVASILCKCRIIGIEGQKIKGEKVYGLIVCVSFTFIMALRDISVGVDTAPYSRIFNTIANADGFIVAIKEAPLTAPVYVIFCKALSYISKDPQILIIASALIINIGLILLVNKVSVNVSASYLAWIGLTLFYCSMNGSRQCIALVLALHALVLLSDNIKNKRAWWLFAIAIMIHSTAIILVFAIGGIILEKKLGDNKICISVSIIASLVIAVGYGIGVKLLLHFVPRYSMYTMEGSTYSIFNSTGGGRIVLLYIILFGIDMLWILRKQNTNKSEDEFVEKMLPALLFGAIFGIINSKNELINRLLWYYLGIYVLCIPSVLSKYKKFERLILTVGVVAVLLTYSIISLRENQNGVVPYSFFW